MLETLVAEPRLINTSEPIAPTWLYVVHMLLLLVFWFVQISKPLIKSYMTTPHALIDRVKNDISSLTSMNSIGIRLELITCIL